MPSGVWWFGGHVRWLRDRMHVGVLATVLRYCVANRCTSMLRDLWHGNPAMSSAEIIKLKPQES